MRKLYKLTMLLCIAVQPLLYAQVKSNYLYSTSMPYGKLDIRTRITSSHYYYLQHGTTFSFREKSPGVKSNTYLDMTSFESSPYQQGHLKLKNGTSNKFVMNYRLLLPNGYSSTYSQGYPLMLLFHGAVERANCYYNSCYHSDWSYDPNVNSPAAPKTSTHKLLNNDHNLSQGGSQHLSARNLAGTKLPNDPTLAARAFPGLVLVPQMFNVWDSLNVQDVIRLVQLVAQKYNVDENRIYVHGLSIGGYAVYEAVKRASWLFAAAQPMSAVRDASIRKYNQTGKIAHIPFWIFQGGTDKSPTPTYTRKLVTDYQNAGAVIRYSEYAGVGHTCWHKAFAEAEFYSWMLKQSKINIHAWKGIKTIVTSKNQYPKLMLAEGFHAYQWEKDGKIISGASSNIYVAKAPGKYRARFSRVPAPTSTQWNIWSPVVTITTGTARTETSEDEFVDASDVEQFNVSTYPNPATPDMLMVSIETPDENQPVKLQLIDQMGKQLYVKEHPAAELIAGMQLPVQQLVPGAMYVLIANQGSVTMRRKIIIQQ